MYEADIRRLYQQFKIDPKTEEIQRQVDEFQRDTKSTGSSIIARYKVSSY